MQVCGKWLFVRNFVKHPKMLSSVVPSSPFLVQRVLGRIDWDRARTIVELGPGIGNFTTEILKRMRPEARIAAIELNYDFVQWLRNSISDPRLHVEHDSAASVRRVLSKVGRKHFDYVIAGIPFSTLPRDTRDSIVEAAHSVLGPEGHLMVYQFSRAILPSLRRVFARVEEEFEPLNIFPARVFCCAK